MPGVLRFIIPFALAAVVTFGLFWLMQSLIGVEGELDKSARTKVVDFVRVKRSEEVKKKEREPPKKEEIDDTPPPPDFQMDQSTSMDSGGIGISAGVDTSMSLDTGGGFSMASADGDADGYRLDLATGETAGDTAGATAGETARGAE